jgi:pyruvate kinase
VLTEIVDRFKMAVVLAARAAREYGFASEKDQIVVTAGVPFNVTRHHEHPARRALRRTA